MTRTKILLLNKKLKKIRNLINMKNVAILLVLLIGINSIGLNAAPASDIGEDGNINPTIDLNVTPVKKPVDIVIVTDYTDTKLTALNTQINNLKAQFSAVNVDPVFYIVSGMKKVGVQNDQLFEFRRYGHFYYKVSGYRRFKDYGLEESYTPYTIDMSVEWERVQGLISQYSNLPVRNPQNVNFTKSKLLIRDTDTVWQSYYDVTFTCTNDVKTSAAVKEETYYHSTGSSSHHIYNTSRDYTNKSFALIKEWAAIDTTWTVDHKISDVSYDVYSLDFNQFSSLSLRAGSDRHMVFLSDGINKDYSQSIGNYFSFGDMQDTLKSYINNNKFDVYGVTPNKTRQTTLYPDKVDSIDPHGDYTLFYMQNGDLLKLGNELLATQLDAGFKLYPELISTPPIEEVPDYKKAFGPEDGCPAYFCLLNDGTITQNGAKTGNVTVPIEGVSDVKDMELCGSSDLRIITNAGWIYFFDYYDQELTKYSAYGYMNKILNISAKGSNHIYLDSSGKAYGLRTRYDDGWDTPAVYKIEIRYTGADGKEYNTAMPAIKDAKEFSWSYNGSGNSGVVVLYTNGTTEVFKSFGDYEIESSSYRTYYPVFYRNEEPYRVIESNVASLTATGNGVFLNKTDGTTKYISTDSSEPKPYTMITAKDVPCSNLKIFDIGYRNTSSYGYNYSNYWYDNFFYTDSSGHVYKFYLDSKSTTSLPILGQTFLDLGDSVKNISIDYRANILNILYENGDLIKRTRGGTYSAPTYTDVVYKDVKNVYTIPKRQTYILSYDGTVTASGQTEYGQLGVVDSYAKYDINPFNTPITINTTNKLYSLLDIFNEIPNNKFYNTGAYATAFNDIYNKYSSSSTGNMYVLLGDEIKYETAYDDYEKDPEYSRKWVIAHDAYYFDNSMGLSAYHNPAGFTINPPTKLDKVGKYTINLYARDNPKANNLFDNYRLWSLGNHNLTVYIHRKPIAMLKLAVTNNGNGTYTVAASDVGSYDLDHSNSRTDKGIVAREWRWKESTSTVWTNTQMNKSDCNPEKSYIVQLRVKDVEGVWSDYDTVNIDRNNPPVALFSLDKTVIRDTEALKVKDQSFPQSFSTIDKWHWVVKKLNSDGSVPAANLQNAQFTNSNAGTGALAGYDANVKTSYVANGVGTYRIYLRVKDSNGLWSDGGTDSTTPADLGKYYSMDFVVDKAPTPSFTVASSVIKTTDLLKIVDTTTTTGISPVAEWHWIVKKLNADGSIPSTNLQSGIFTNHNAGSGTLAGYDANVKTDYSASGVGTYRIYLRAANGNGMWSDGGTDSTFTLSSFFYRDIVVDSPPVASFTIANSPMGVTDLMKLRDTSVKTGVSAINRWHWMVKKLNADGSVPATFLQNTQFTNSNAGTGVLAGYDGNVKTDYSTNGIGTYRIYLRVRNANGMWSDGGTDAAANLASCYSGDLIVKTMLDISNVKISGYWNHWRGQVDMFGKQLTTEPHRFLSLEKVKITADVSGGADKVVIRFSPELEAMQFTDASGNVYNYSEQVGSTVTFPAGSTVTLNPALTDTSVTWEYILPLAQSTIGWDDIRKRPSYSMTITAWKGTSSVSAQITDVEVTGNTYDLIYMQPR